MIIYATNETMKRYNLKCPNEVISPEIKELSRLVVEKEKGDPLYAWGMKLFYFNGRKCVQFMNAQTRITVFLFFKNMADRGILLNDVAHYLLWLYDDDLKMQDALKKYYNSSPLATFDKITDRSLISTLNYNEMCFNNVIERYVENGVLQTKKINRSVANYLTTVTINGKKQYVVPKEIFREAIMKRFGADNYGNQET